MTPLEVEILLHYHSRVSDYRDGNFSAPAVRDAIDAFGKSGYLTPGTVRKYDPTEKLHAHVAAICSVPEPIQHWEIPWPTKHQHPRA